jgi:FMN-dependent NADH-azoreductase
VARAQRERLERQLGQRPQPADQLVEQGAAAVRRLVDDGQRGDPLSLGSPARSSACYNSFVIHKRLALDNVMASHLLQIDSSLQREGSISRRLTARAAAAWRAAHPDGTVAYRDLAADPIPHVDGETFAARLLARDQHTPAQQRSWALSEQLIGELEAADTILLGLPVYNYAAPSQVKSWVDHLIAPGLSYDAATRAGLLAGRDLIVLESRGGGYAPGTPREGWDHAEQWLPHGLAMTGLEPRFITAELTLAGIAPGMDELIPLAEQSLAEAERAIDELWTPVAA